MKGYPRFTTQDSKPFDPLELAAKTEKIVTRKGREGLERKYVGIYSAPVYGGIASGYAVGCCLRCIYCWTNWSRDFPELFGEFHSPAGVAQKLFEAAAQGITASGWERFRNLKVKKLRLSGCEPLIGKEHLLSVLSQIKDSAYPLFILETNGILFGADRDYARRLSEFKEKLYVRVSFKAATPAGFTQRSGALGKYYELPFRALEYLLDEGVYARAAAMTDSNVMPPEESKFLIERLDEIDPKVNYARTLEEEKIDAYDTTIKRIKAFNDPEFAKALEEEIKKGG